MSVGEAGLAVEIADLRTRFGAREMIRGVDLPRPYERIKTYSLGMRQRLGIARCLLADPELLILDEVEKTCEHVAIVVDHVSSCGRSSTRPSTTRVS